MESKCELHPVEHVCGSDGVTHANECFLNMTACITKKSINVVHKGLCDSELTNELSSTNQT